MHTNLSSPASSRIYLYFSLGRFEVQGALQVLQECGNEGQLCVALMGLVDRGRIHY